MKSIGLKLWSGMMLLVGIVLLLLVFFQIVFLKAFYSDMKISEITNKANSVISLVEASGSLSVSAPIIEQLEGLVQNNQLSVEIADIAGNIIYSDSYANGNSSAAGMFRQASSEVFKSALLDKQAKKEVTQPRFGTKIVLIGLPIHIGTSVRGAMVVNMPMSPVEDTAEILKKQLLIISGILLLVAVLIAISLSQAFTKPVLDITKAAESYSLGNFDYRIRNNGNDEISLLAMRMNKMGEELLKNEQLQKDIIANVSHELRTPLSLIKGYAETLKDVTGGIPEKREKQLGIIIDESDRLSRIVEDILSLSQFQAGAISLEIKAFPFKEMLEAVMLRYELIKDVRNFSAEIGLNGNIIGDKGRIEQVLYNLINNAYNHTSEGDFIIIRAYEKADLIRIEVEDSGEGMEKDELNHVFERYYKGNTERSKRTGTGLGLAIVKSILEMHKAQYGVESTLGKGTIFWFELKKEHSQSSF